MTYNYRCTKARCRRRETKSHPLEWYKRACDTVCPSCGGRLSLDPTMKRRTKRLRCYCDGYPWDGPHRKGSLWCIHYEGEITEQDMRDRAYTMMRGNQR